MGRGNIGWQLANMTDNDHLSDTASGKGPSPKLWSDCPLAAIMFNPGKGWCYTEHFLKVPVLANNATSEYDAVNSYNVYSGATTGKTVGVKDEVGGILQLFTSTNNEGTGLVACNSSNDAGEIKLSSTTPKSFWFEARLKHINVTDSKAGVFVGFAEEALNTANSIIAAAGTLADKDLVGFWRLEGDGDKYDIYCNTSGAGGVTAIKADAATIEADTYHKVGMHVKGKFITFFYDGEPVAVYQTDGTNFPDAEELAFYIAITAAADDDFYVEVDWVRIAQLL